MSSDLSDEEKLEEIRKLVRRNNVLLSRLYAAHQRARMGRLLYWLVVIGLAVAAYFYLSPYIDRIEDMYHNAQMATEEISEFYDRIRGEDEDGR